MSATRKERLKSAVVRRFGPALTTRVRCLVRGKSLPRWGNLRRVTSFSNSRFGFDRGTPIDRYYVDAFFEQHRAFITGDVLEIDNNLYSRRYVQNPLTVHSFDIDPACGSTFVCDLAHSEGVLPTEAYDCLLMPCTLQALRELEPALANALRVVRTGGVILATGPGLIPLDGSAAGDYWHLTPAGWREVTRRVWSGCEVIVRGYGNCLASSAAIFGLAAEELRSQELDYLDEIYPVITTVFCRKRVASPCNAELPTTG